MDTRKILFTLLLLAFLTGTHQVQAQDGFFSNAQTLQKGTLAIGLQPVILTAQDDFMFIGRTSYGLRPGLTGHLKVGFLDEETYVGAHFEGNLASEPTSKVSLALLAGAYSYGDLGLKLGLNLSKDFDPFSLYSGINYQPLFTEVESIHSFLVPVGIDLHLKRGTLDLMLEGDIPISDAEYLEAITFGARVYLN